MLLKKSNLVTAALLSSCLVSTTTIAGSEIALLIDMLRDNGTVSEAQYQRLQAELKQIQSQNQTSTQIEPPVQTTQAIKPVVVKAASDQFTAQLGGRLQIDAASYSGDPKMGNGTEVRRAYLTLKGTLSPDWAYRFQYNFADTGEDGKGILDAFVAYQGMDDFDVTIGNFKAPFTLHEATSDNFVTFTERASIAAFSPGRQIGAMISDNNDDRTWAIGAFGESVSQHGGEEDEAFGISSRATWSPLNQPRQVLHLGLGMNYQQTGSLDTVRYKQQAETHVAGVNLVDTGVINQAENVLKLGAEFAGVWGPFATQIEYVSTRVNRNKVDDVHFDGWYVETSYFLTGESRHYSQGHFARTIPFKQVGTGGSGAWQLALRYSELDLNDGAILGGETEAVTLGLNWFPTSALRFSANYVDVLSVDGGPNADLTPRLFQVRSQWSF